MDQGTLLERGPREDGTPDGALPPRLGPRRLRHAVRTQVEFQECSLDELLPEEHEARIVWAYVCSLDLAELHQRIQAVEGGPGQAPADPRIPLSLWLYATLRGVGSARELNRLCEHHAADEAKAIYRERAATAECVNALARNRGLQRFLVRGLRKVKAVALWYALAHNLMRAVALRAVAAQGVV